MKMKYRILAFGLLLGCASLFQSCETSGNYQVRSKDAAYAPIAPSIEEEILSEAPGFNTEEYDRIVENDFRFAMEFPLSTFGIDVDNASYSNTRRFLMNGSLPPVDAVRIEELINYFKYDYAKPIDEHPFAVGTEVVECPWNMDHHLVKVGIKGMEVTKEELPPSNLVFLLDVSGSMDAPNKLPLLRNAFKLLVKELRPEDRVAIVTYAGSSGLLLPSTSGNEKRMMRLAIDDLQAGGSTAGASGIKLAYRVAEEHLIKGGNNRIILATDGDFNVGVSSTSDLVRLIEEKREKGIFLSVLGLGTGNYKDARMEQIADNGNGNYYYLDNLNEARKVLVKDLTQTIYTIAKDVKLQVEFNPAKVQQYRLLGYENRILKDEEFNDDRKDSGDLGAGHTVTAFYEVVPVGVEPVAASDVATLKYQNRNLDPQAEMVNELLTLKLRYKQPDGDTSQLLEYTTGTQVTSITESSDDFRFAASVAGFGMLLRGSKYSGSLTWDQVHEMADRARGEDPNGYRAEFINMIELAKSFAQTEAGIESAEH